MKWQVMDGKALTAQAAVREASQRVAQGADAVLVHCVAGGPLHWLHGEHARARPLLRLEDHAITFDPAIVYLRRCRGVGKGVEDKIVHGVPAQAAEEYQTVLERAGLFLDKWYSWARRSRYRT